VPSVTDAKTANGANRQHNQIIFLNCLNSKPIDLF